MKLVRPVARCERLWAGSWAEASPHVGLGDRVLFSPDAAQGLAFLDERSGRATPELGQSRGVLEVAEVTPDGLWIAGLRYVPEGGTPRAQVVSARDGRTIDLPAPPRSRTDIAGFLGGAP